MNCTKTDCEAYNPDYVGNCGDDLIWEVTECPDAELDEEELPG